MPKAKVSHLRCTVADCSRLQKARMLCDMHYKRLLRLGSVTAKNKMGVGDTPEQRFWSKVALTADDQKCWEWQGACFPNGYGQTQFKRRPISTHRMAWFYRHGYFPDLLILHSCDNPPCVNPEHLRVGTPADNMRDKVERGRANTVRGECVGSAKLDKTAILQIRADNRSQSVIARVYNIAQSNVSHIKSRKTWSHV